jgi:hypothetical protein
LQIATAETTGKEVGGYPWIRWHQTFDVGYVPNNIVPNVFMAVALDLRDDEHTYVHLSINNMKLEFYIVLKIKHSSP